MGRTVDQEVHAAFVEFRAKEDDKCLSVQCIYCQQIRAKNTSRQKQHLLECPALRGHNPPHAQSAPTNGVGAVNGYGAPPNGPAGGPGAGSATATLPSASSSMMANGVNPHSSALQTPMQNLSSRPSLPSQAAPPPSASSAAAPSQQRAHTTPKTSKQPRQSTSSLPAPPLDDVHAAFVEFRAKEEDKLPIPTLELDFRMSLKLNPTVTVGQGLWGQRDWVTFVGGQWAGRWGKGIVLPGGQDSQVVVKELSTHIKANYLLQTADDPPAFIVAKTTGWMTGAKDVLEKLSDPSMADSVNPTTYKYRIHIALETGDERYAFVNTVMWVGSGCRRSSEVIFDAFRIT
ncbi:conserved hypothetical protein [Histoplasma capsulatum var. duboisii H88]|uniref:Uncharacterized protein n=1 Tax=Ajellomyces capsulatus (strain H88) TaxID=544711 RepID=F0UVE4_AJEC8|nr:conserved hypothetical protein [Histoplasma capsulatum var. duboisii H88]